MSQRAWWRLAISVASVLLCVYFLIDAVLTSEPYSAIIWAGLLGFNVYIIWRNRGGTSTG